MAALCKQPYWKSSSGELQQFVLTLYCCLLIRNRAWLGRQSSGTNTQLSLELGVHKRETRVPCHERSVQGSGFFPPLYSVRNISGGVGVELLRSAGNHVRGHGRHSRLREACRGVSLPAARWCWYEHLHPGAGELVKGSAGRFRARKIKEVNNNEQKACWFPISRVETRGIVILVARIAQIGSVLLAQCLTLCWLEPSHRTARERWFHGLGVVAEPPLMLVANCKFGLALDFAGDVHISKHIHFLVQY